jgi:hypothetical protein
LLASGSSLLLSNDDFDAWSSFVCRSSSTRLCGSLDIARNYLLRLNCTQLALLGISRRATDVNQGSPLVKRILVQKMLCRARKYIFPVKLKYFMRRMLLFTVLCLCLAALILYAVDYASVRFGSAPLGAVTVTRYYVIPKKNGKEEFVFQPPELEKCVHSLFSHAGYRPCWYLNRHPEQPITM